MSALPSQFRRIHLVLAREPGHPQGSSRIGYDLTAPLNETIVCSAELWEVEGPSARDILPAKLSEVHARIVETEPVEVTRRTSEFGSLE